MVQWIEVTSIKGDTEAYTSYDFSGLINTITNHPGLPKTKSFSVKVTEEKEYVQLCTLCDEQGLDKASVELVEPVLNF